LERGGFPHQSSNIYSAIYTALQRREEQGDVSRMGSEWAMASWFPGRGRKPKEEPAAKRPKKSRAAKAGAGQAVPRMTHKKLKAPRAALDEKGPAAAAG
jgi:hypothetical protein